MRRIRVKIKEIRKRLYVRLPKLVAEQLKCADGDEIEISFHKGIATTQINVWDKPVKDIYKITIELTDSVSGINKYHRLYIPSKYRFFFPPSPINFVLQTEKGNFLTHITLDGFIKKNFKKWLSLNQQVQGGDKIIFKKVNGQIRTYDMSCEYKSTTMIESGN